MSLLATPGYQLQPSSEQVAAPYNYLTNADDRDWETNNLNFLNNF